MPGRPIISKQALADLDEIWLYIAQDNVTMADRVIERIYDEIQKLARMPGLGHRREDLTDKPVRFWLVYSYLVIYNADTKPIEVVRILSGHRDIAAIL